ncbi:glutathione S-transferase family protein [Providencia stuartii]|uniref:glutathione S-transferase family protein n=1 Tax=Providencia stuartii TaxID=588 RepID=UPI0028BFA963|nr:glutathione S-transferase family protein [Providencia stuartii]MDT7048537.1 glutathione S-transferase family protein [Providencia stuartii]
MLKILGRTTSINVRKVLWAAQEAQLPFIHEPQWGDELSLKSADYLKLNPNGLVPVLIHENGILWESNTICRYIATKAQRFDLLPESPEEKADVEKWMDWQATELNSAWRAAFMALVRKSDSFIQYPELIAKSTDEWNSKMLLLEAELEKNGNFINGKQFTVADITLALSIHRWLLTPIIRPNTPAISQYYQQVLTRPAAKLYLAPNIP